VSWLDAVTQHAVEIATEQIAESQKKHAIAGERRQWRGEPQALSLEVT
jgi:hypothetical protein